MLEVTRIDLLTKKSFLKCLTGLNDTTYAAPSGSCSAVLMQCICSFLGTDRINIAQIRDLNDNLPLPFEQTTMWENADVIWMHHGKTDISPKDVALDLSSAGYYRYLQQTF